MEMASLVAEVAPEPAALAEPESGALEATQHAVSRSVEPAPVVILAQLSSPAIPFKPAEQGRGVASAAAAQAKVAPATLLQAPRQQEMQRAEIVHRVVLAPMERLKQQAHRPLVAQGKLDPASPVRVNREPRQARPFSTAPRDPEA